MKQLFTIGLTLLFCFANAQISTVRDGRLIEDSEGRFIGDIKVLGIMNRATIDVADKTGFLNEYTLKMKVWDYLGEPMEMYAFQWSRNKSYTVKVDNEIRSITLEKLEEYPDLQKRFTDLRPTKVDIGISGYVGDGKSKNELQVGEIIVEESSVPVNVFYSYTVKDVDLLIAREGEYREPTIAGSPPTWNEFFNWSYNDPMGPSIKLNVSEASFNKLSEEDQKQRIKKIKNIWKQVKQISVSASIKTLAWPELEMIDIIKTYDRYKNNIKELSPQEKLDAELAKVQATTEYTKKDDWGELPELIEPKLMIDYNQEENYYFIGYANTDIILSRVESKNQIFPIIPGTKEDENFCDCIINLSPYFMLRLGNPKDKLNDYQIIDSNGSVVIDGEYHYVIFYEPEDHQKLRRGDNWRDGANSFKFSANGNRFILIKYTNPKKFKVYYDESEKIHYREDYFYRTEVSTTTYIYDENLTLLEEFNAKTLLR